MYIRYMLLLSVIMLTSWIKILNNRHNGCYLLLETDHSLWSFTLFLACFFGVFWVFTRGLLTSLKRLEITTTTADFPKPSFNWRVCDREPLNGFTSPPEPHTASCCMQNFTLLKERRSKGGVINSPNPDFAYSESNKKLVHFFPYF